MKISILTVTHNRFEFMPWLLWNYQRQAWPDKNLVIVDSSDESVEISPAQADIHVIHAPGANVPAKRNLALAAATGDAITWLDDDDWRHPASLSVLAEGIGRDTAVSGGRWAWFMELETGRVSRFCDRRGVLFGCVLVDTAVARAVRFDERETRGSDLTWMETVLQRPFAFTYDPLSFFLCHDRNLGNLAAAHQFNREIDDVKNAVGDAWPGTGRRLATLRRQLWK